MGLQCRGPSPIPELYLREWREHDFSFFIVCEKTPCGGVIFVGRCGLRSLSSNVELGFCLNSQASGRGLATEAASRMVDFAFAHHNMKKLVGLVRPSNAQSTRVLQKLGFVYKALSLERGVQCRFCELHRAAKNSALL